MRSVRWTTICAVVVGVAAAMPASAPAGSGVASKGVQSASQARGFWTQKRMAEARPAQGFALPAPSDLFGFGASEPPGPQGPPQSVAATRSGAPVRYADAVTIDDTTPEGIRTQGKVFFRKRGNTFFCSGTVVTSSNESTVWTAAHCLYDQSKGSFVRRLIFVPAYDKDSRPFGTWAAQSLYVTSKWARGGPESSDYGSALMATDPPQRSCAGLETAKKRRCKRRNRRATTIQEIVGSRGIAFNQPRDQTWTAFGYPQKPEPRFDGQDLEACTDSLKLIDLSQGNPHPIGIDCDMQVGASGGGWVIDADDGNGAELDTVNGNVAYGYPNLDPNTVYSPYFGNAVQDFYGVIENCPLAGCEF